MDKHGQQREVAADRPPCATRSTSPAVVVPICVSRLDGRRHELSPKAMRFAEALSFTDGWSRISDARSRRAA